MEKRAITVQNLSKTYGKFKAVDRLDFHVNTAECFGLLGPNGAGKTTTMKILYGKALADSNSDTVIDILGCHPQRDALKIKTMTAIVPQQDNLDLELSVTDNLFVYSKFYGIPAVEARIRITELLTFMELTEKAHANVRELSGGMQRRLTIARALINRPRILILDEPTTGLDPQVRHLIWNKLRELKESGVSILLTTHYMEEAFQICDRMVVMDHGKKILEGNPRELLEKNIERHVVEVYGAGILDDSLKDCLDHSGIRYEYHMDTLFAFSDDASELTRFAESLSGRDHYVRRSNLEDVFLKATGRTLNELQ